jgi:predicted TIM-barrel fold metal-dependent hydrolase
MKRRDFVRLAASVPAIWAFGCSGDDEDAGPVPPSRILGRTALGRFDGLTSMHEHVDSERGAEILLAAMAEVGIAHTLLLGAYETLLHGAKKPDWESAARNNDLLLKLVAAHPAELSMFALLDGREADPIAALRGYLDRGARGIKMYNGVSNSHRAMSLEAPPLQPLFRFCDLHGVPILVHVDPPNLDEFLRVIRDYPNARWICPHLFVQTRPENLARLDRILVRHPNVHTDMSFGFEGWMHSNLMRLSESRDRVREIFIRHADRLFFGTDVVVATNSSHRTVDWAVNSFSEYRKLLELDGFHHRVKSRKKTYEGEVRGLALPDDVLKKIYVENARRFFAAPRPGYQGDDLDTVLTALPAGAKLGDGGRQALLVVAAVGVLSPIRELGADLGAGGVRLVADAELAAAAARLSVPKDSLEVLAGTAAVQERAARDPGVVALLAFGDLQAGLRSLPVAGVDPCVGAAARCAANGEATRRACFGEYPLLLPLSTDVGEGAARFDPHELRSVMMTGGSLPGNGMLETQNVSPGEAVAKIAPLTRAADITHMSIENTVAERCVQNLKDWKFCYAPEWLESIDLLGADVIELTGNHLRDFGEERAAKTIAEYDVRGYPHFGGGKDLADALRPAVIGIRGLRIGFVGINRLNGENSGASADAAGPLTQGAGNFEQVLEAAKRECDAFIFTYQGGYEFSATPWNDMVLHAHEAIDAGAVGAFGMHSHVPMGAEVYGGALVSYGLGNFLFRHPPSAIPHSAMTERAMVCRLVLYGRKLLQATLIPIEMAHGAIAPCEGNSAESVFARVRRGSYAGLSPQRALKRFADARSVATTEKSLRQLLTAHLKLGLSGQLISMTDTRAAEAGSAARALDMLREELRQHDRWRSKGVKLAVPLAAGWSLPPGGFDAVRIQVTDDQEADARSIEIAARAGVPIQLAVPGRTSAAAIEGRIGRAGKVPVIIPGLQLLLDEREAAVDLLRRNPDLMVDTSGNSPADYERLFGSLAADREWWRAFFRKFPGRVLLASGGMSTKKMTGMFQANVVRALRWALERETFRVPVLNGGKLNEWSGYPYDEETDLDGLSLEPEIVDAVVGGNFHGLFGA